MALSNFYLTDKGNALLARAQAGTTLTITRAQVGEGTWPEGTTYANIAALVKPVKYLSIVSKSQSSGQVKITVQFSNSGVGRVFQWTEFGLWAADPDYPDDRSRDILYGTAYAGDTPVPIESALTEFLFNVLVKTGQAANVTVTIDSSLIYLTQESLDSTLEALKGQANGLAELGEDGKVPEDQLPEMDYDPAGSAAAVKEELEKVINTKAVKSYGVLSAANVLTWAKQQNGSGAFNVNPTVTTEGVPTAAWYSGFLEKSADGAYKLTLTRSDNGQTFVNVTYAQEWIGWIELATVDELADKVGLAGNVSELGDMNLANIANQFYVILESDAIQNLPYNSLSFNNSVVYNRGQENAIFTQTLYTPQLKAVYQRYYIGWWPEESRWSEWEQIATITSEPSTAGARAISVGTTDLTAGSSALATGQIHLVYG